MKIKIHLFICVVFCSQFFVFGNQQYTNPILHPANFGNDSAADPFVFKDDDGTYYMYVTGQGYPCFSSKDLVNWTYAGNVFRKATAKWATQKFWAPELVKVGSTYYLHYSAAADDGIMRIGMAKSTSPKGPFQDISNKPFFQQGIDKGCIDSHIFFDDDGRVYMYYSNAMSTNPIPGTNKKRSEIWVVELSTDLTETIGEAKRLFFPSQSWEKNPTAQNYWNEAPSVIKHDSKYYILYSANSYSSSDYAIGYATSDSPLGPFTKYAFNPILSNKGREAYVSGTGHQSVVTSPDETQMFCVYHSHIDLVVQGNQRMVNIDRMGFSEDGLLYITGPTVTPQPYPSDNALDIRGIKELKLILKIQPNPATNYIQIDMPFDASHVSIYSADGLLHYSLPISQNKTIIKIPVVSFPSGMYIVRLKDSKMNKLVGKFMKN